MNVLRKVFECLRKRIVKKKKIPIYCQLWNDIVTFGKTLLLQLMKTITVDSQMKI